MLPSTSNAWARVSAVAPDFEMTRKPVRSRFGTAKNAIEAVAVAVVQKQKPLVVGAGRRQMPGRPGWRRRYRARRGDGSMRAMPRPAPGALRDRHARPGVQGRAVFRQLRARRSRSSARPASDSSSSNLSWTMPPGPTASAKQASVSCFKGRLATRSDRGGLGRGAASPRQLRRLLRGVPCLAA